MSKRVERLRPRLKQPLLVSNQFNLRYLTGFRSTNAALLVEPERAVLYTDFRYADAARQVEGVEFLQTRRDLWGHLAELLSGRIGFEATDLTYDRFETLQRGGLELVPTRGLVEVLRAVKDEGELLAIRRAAEITNAVFAELAEESFVDRTEREIARWIAGRYLEAGSEGIAFDVAVAAGANGAIPHGKPRDQPIEEDTTVVVDCGCTIEGYNSDCTRTFITGMLPAELDRAYEVCRAAQECALGAVTAGARGVDVDGVARGAIGAEGFGEAFGHGLGHGVGLEVH
jgi:Xaa-Pro aminopeptidase